MVFGLFCKGWGFTRSKLAWADWKPLIGATAAVIMSDLIIQFVSQNILILVVVILTLVASALRTAFMDLQISMQLLKDQMEILSSVGIDARTTPAFEKYYMLQRLHLSVFWWVTAFVTWRMMIGPTFFVTLPWVMEVGNALVTFLNVAYVAWAFRLRPVDPAYSSFDLLQSAFGRASRWEGAAAANLAQNNEVAVQAPEAPGVGGAGDQDGSLASDAPFVALTDQPASAAAAAVSAGGTIAVLPTASARAAQAAAGPAGAPASTLREGSNAAAASSAAGTHVIQVQPLQDGSEADSAGALPAVDDFDRSTRRTSLIPRDPEESKTNNGVWTRLRGLCLPYSRLSQSDEVDDDDCADLNDGAEAGGRRRFVDGDDDENSAPPSAFVVVHPTMVAPDGQRITHVSLAELQLTPQRWPVQLIGWLQRMAQRSAPWRGGDNAGAAVAVAGGNNGPDRGPRYAIRPALANRDIELGHINSARS